MADGEGGWPAIVETIKELGPVGWFMLGAGSVLGAIRRGWLIFGEKATLAHKVGTLESDLKHAKDEIAERDATIAALRSADRNSPPKE